MKWKNLGNVGMTLGLSLVNLALGPKNTPKKKYVDHLDLESNMAAVQSIIYFCCKPPFWKKASILHEVEEFRKCRDDLSLMSLALGQKNTPKKYVDHLDL